MNDLFKITYFAYLLSIMSLGFAHVAYPKEQGFVLLISLYNETDEERIQEYITCIERNLEHPLIHTIHVLYDTSKDHGEKKLFHYVQSKNLKLSFITSRPTYDFCFNVANILYPHSKIILSNADIYFNETLHHLSSYDLENTFLALTRWDVKKDGSLELFKQYYNGKLRLDMSYASQDAWIFKTPLKKFKDASIRLGTMTCDTLIAYQAWAAGLNVFNPCLTIQCCHLHLSHVRHYDKWGYVFNKPLKILPWVTLAGESVMEYPIIHELRNLDIYYRLQQNIMIGMNVY